MKILSPTVAFGLKFLVCFAVLMGAFEASRGTSVERHLVEDGILRPTTALIRLIAPDDHVELAGRSIVTPGSRLNVTRGCEGVEIFLLLVAGVLAFPAAWTSRFQALGIGFVLAYALSVSRLIALHLALRHAPRTWEMLHGLVLPLAPILLVTLYFMRWSSGIALEGRSGAT